MTTSRQRHLTPWEPCGGGAATAQTTGLLPLLHHTRLHRRGINAGLEDLARGKVLYPGVSNYSAWQTQRAVDIQEQRHWARLQAIQPMYNLVKRQAEVELLPMAEANSLGVTPYSPAAAGLLSGKYSVDGSTGRVKNNQKYEARYGEKWMFDVADAFVDFCKRRV